MMMLFGIRECDTCRKALRWAESRGHDLHFHDLRRDGLDKELLQQWLQSVELDELINRRSRTWRELSDEDRGDPDIALLLAHPTLIKRPVLVQAGEVLAVGFDLDRWETLL